MRPRCWLILCMAAFPMRAPAQTVKEADIIGGWRSTKVEYANSVDSAKYKQGPDADADPEKSVKLVLWPDGLWLYSGALMGHFHGGARWRLVGDTLWLGNDYYPYYHPMLEDRWRALRAMGLGIGVIDTDVIRNRAPFPVPDSIYWSPAFRDTTSACTRSDPNYPCGTWVYQVSVQGSQLSLVRVDRLSRAVKGVATKIVFMRDSLE